MCIPPVMRVYLFLLVFFFLRTHALQQTRDTPSSQDERTTAPATHEPKKQGERFAKGTKQIHLEIELPNGRRRQSNRRWANTMRLAKCG